MARRSPPVPVPLVHEPKEIGLRTDADFIGSVVLMVGSFASKILTGMEHLEFLASAREGGFKVLIDAWNSGLWWIVGAIGFIWAFYRFQRRADPHPKGPTWGLCGCLHRDKRGIWFDAYRAIFRRHTQSDNDHHIHGYRHAGRRDFQRL